MKTHMMKMHNINIDEHPAEAAANSIVGGVMCDLCKKELCSVSFKCSISITKLIFICQKFRAIL